MMCTRGILLFCSFLNYGIKLCDFSWREKVERGGIKGCDYLYIWWFKIQIVGPSFSPFTFFSNNYFLSHHVLHLLKSELYPLQFLLHERINLIPLNQRFLTFKINQTICFIMDKLKFYVYLKYHELKYKF